MPRDTEESERDGGINYNHAAHGLVSADDYQPFGIKLSSADLAAKKDEYADQDALRR